MLVWIEAVFFYVNRYRTRCRAFLIAPRGVYTGIRLGCEGNRRLTNDLLAAAQIRNCAALLIGLGPTLDARTQAGLYGRLLVPHAGTQGLAYALLSADLAAQAHTLGACDLHAGDLGRTT